MHVLLTKKAIIVHKQMREQTTTLVHSGERVMSLSLIQACFGLLHVVTITLLLDFIQESGKCVCTDRIYLVNPDPVNIFILKMLSARE